MGEVTQLLEAVQRGEGDATPRLFTLVYDELKAIAHGAARRQPGRQLDTTALVHECFMRLAGGPEAKNRGHFYALAARAMRQILCDQGRRTLASKRGGGAAVSNEVEGASDPRPQAEELVSLDRLFTRLSAVDARAAQVMECRVFGGFTVPETAEALGVSERTVYLDFERARTWLAAELQG
jgi:RNA polymerase sigma factor (TIGR02999 family)